MEGITHSALTKLINYDWPGNIRELHNILERAANLTQDGYIDVDHLPNAFHNNLFTPPSIEVNTPSSKSYWDAIDLKEEELILAALKASNGNKTKASKALGISRTWLYEKMKKYNI